MIDWLVTESPEPSDVAVIAAGVTSHGRLLAIDGGAKILACVLRQDGKVVAGSAGRTEYNRLFVHYLWVSEELRGQGLGRKILQEMENQAFGRGCKDSMLETLSDEGATWYQGMGYGTVASIPGYVGRFTRHILLKPALYSSACGDA